MIKKRILFSALLICVSASIHAFDFGGSLGTYTKLGTPAVPGDDEFKNYSLKQEEILTGWFRHDFDSSMFIASEVDVRFRTTASNLEKTDDIENVVIPDVKLLRISKKIGSASNTILVNAGRFYFADISGTIFSQPSDGLNVLLSSRRVNAKVYANYTGLLNAQNVTILNKKDSSYALDTKKGWYFAAPYTNAGLSVDFPYLFANQTLSAEFLASFGTPGIEDGTSGYNRLWGTLGLNGFILKNLCYVFTTTFGTELEDGVSNLTKLSFTYLPKFKSMTVSVFGHYASGEQFGLKPFKGFTKSTVCSSAVEPEYSGIVKTGANISIKPVKSILAGLNGSAVFSCPKDDFEYKGFEAGISGNFQIFSDLNINGSFTQFAAKEKNDSKATFTLSATLAF